MKSYKDLDVYNLAFEYAIEVHKMTGTLPSSEKYEQGSQIRRSAMSIKDNIVEGYGRRRYKQDFIKFLVYAHASLLECISQLEMLNAIYPEISVSELITKYELLGGKIHLFINYVEKDWKV